MQVRQPVSILWLFVTEIFSIEKEFICKYFVCMRKVKKIYRNT